MNRPQFGDQTFSCPPAQMSFEDLCDLVDTQQRIIRFLNAEYQTLLDQIATSGRHFGPVSAFTANDTIPSGWWQCVSPTTGVVGTVTVGGAPVSLFAPLFWSDGTAVATLAFSACAIAARPTPTSP